MKPVQWTQSEGDARLKMAGRAPCLDVQRTAGFTLIEIMISAALMSLILVAAYLCLNAGLTGKKIIEPRADLLQNARVAMTLLSADLRAACPLSKDTPFLGMKRMIGEVEADNLDFATHNFTPRRANEGDFCEVSYYVQKDEQSGRFDLWRRQNPTFAPDPLQGGKQEEIAQDILGISFQYSDGQDWYDTWGATEGQAKADNSQKQQSNLTGLPQAVRIVLLLDSDPKSKIDPATGERIMAPPQPFETVAYLNLAAVANDASAGAVGAAPSDDNSGQSGTGTSGGIN